MERRISLEEKVKKVNALIDNTPNGYIVDADTLLCDVMENADFE